MWYINIVTIIIIKECAMSIITTVQFKIEGLSEIGPEEIARFNEVADYFGRYSEIVERRKNPRNDNPNDYDRIIRSWDDEKYAEEYVQEMNSLFSQYLTVEKSYT